MASRPRFRRRWTPLGSGLRRKSRPDSGEGTWPRCRIEARWRVLRAARLTGHSPSHASVVLASASSTERRVAPLPAPATAATTPANLSRPPGGRRCACGLHDISHKRAGAKYFDEACRKRASRARAAAVQLQDYRSGVNQAKDTLCRCNGPLIRDTDGDFACLSCGKHRGRLIGRVARLYDVDAATMEELPHGGRLLPRKRPPRPWTSEISGSAVPPTRPRAAA